MNGLWRLPWRLSRRGAVLLCASAAVYAVVEVVSYEATYPDAQSRAQLAQLSDSAAVRALQGVPHAIDTTGGFVTWDAGWFLAMVVSTWTVLVTTRVLRAEEDTGRAELVLSRPVRPVRLLIAQLGVVALVVLAFGVTVAASLVAQGLPLSGSVLLGAGLSGVGLVFTGVAALAAQLLDVRRRAVAAGLGALGLAFVLRMYANTSDDRDWLLQLTPLGGLDLLEPFAAERWTGLLPMVVVPAVLLALAVRERAVRDSGAARLSGREHRPPRLRLLGGPVAFGWRTTRGVLVAWSVGVALFGAVLGSVVSAVVDLVEDDPDYAAALEQLGADMSNPAEGFLGVMAIALAMVFGLFVSWRIGSLRTEEAAGRLDHLLVRAVGRRRWLAGSYALAVVAALVVTLSGALGIWLGARLGGTGLGWDDAALPLLATLPVAVLFAGIGVLAFGVAPRLTVGVPVALVVLAYVLEVLGVALSLPEAVLDLSPFRWLPQPPAEPWTAAPSLVLCGIGLAAAAAGTALFARRDLQPD